MILSHFTKHHFMFIDDYPYSQKNRHNQKPHGLWLSDESDFGWKEWCTAEDFKVDHLAYETKFTIKPGSNVLRLESESDIVGFHEEYSVLPDWYRSGDNRFLRTPDWERVSREYDGILITPYYRLWDRFMTWHDCWDVSSGCFWNTDILEML